MKKPLKLFVLLTCAFSLTVWSCKPSKTTGQGNTEEVEQAVQEAEPMGELSAGKKPTTMIGSCSYYKGIEGMATITQLDASNVEEAIIKFTFEPDAPYNSKMKGKSMSGQIFNVEGVGMYPPRDWAIDKGLVQGAKIPCVRYEINMENEQEASCETIKYDFPQFKEDSWK